MSAPLSALSWTSAPTSELLSTFWLLTASFLSSWLPTAACPMSASVTWPLMIFEELTEFWPRSAVFTCPSMMSPVAIVLAA